jgi:hypothetical protein
MQQRKAIDTLAISLLLCGQFPATALAQESTDPMQACARMTDRDARLACFDHEMQRRDALAAHGASAAPVAPAATAPPSPSGTPVTTAKQRLPDDTIGLDGKQLSIKRKEEGIEPEPVKPFVAAIVKLEPRPGHLYYFELDNGQVWESIEGESELFLGAHETVTIRPGVLGAFFLKTQEGNSIRVHRVR